MDDQEQIGRFWRLVDPLTVQQAAVLVADSDPNFVRFDGAGEPQCFADETGLTSAAGFDRVKTAFVALVNAINAGLLPAIIRRSAWERGWDEEPDQGERFTKDVTLLQSDIDQADKEANPHFAKHRGVIYRVEPDWSKTTIKRDDLIEWLSSKGFHTGFFFPDAADTPDYLDPLNPRYASRLAAAVRAWQACDDALQGKSPKQVLMKWLRENAKDFGLSDEDGNPNETGIEECAKVANWKPGGGAPKTSGQ